MLYRSFYPGQITIGYVLRPPKMNPIEKNPRFVQGKWPEGLSAFDESDSIAKHFDDLNEHREVSLTKLERLANRNLKRKTGWYGWMVDSQTLERNRFEALWDWFQDLPEMLFEALMILMLVKSTLLKSEMISSVWAFSSRYTKSWKIGKVWKTLKDP